MTQYRSYHGTDGVKAIQFIWPSVPADLAKAAIEEMDQKDWTLIEDEREREFQKALWLFKRLGSPANG